MRIDGGYRGSLYAALLPPPALGVRDVRVGLTSPDTLKDLIATLQARGSEGAWRSAIVKHMRQHRVLRRGRTVDCIAWARTWTLRLDGGSATRLNYFCNIGDAANTLAQASIGLGLDWTLTVTAGGRATTWRVDWTHLAAAPYRRAYIELAIPTETVEADPTIVRFEMTIRNPLEPG